MADLIRQIERDIERRMADLRPAVAEAGRLEQALAALTNGAEAARPRRRPARRAARPKVAATTRVKTATKPAREQPETEPTAASPAKPTATPRARISQAEAEARERQSLAIITEHPGTTAANLALLLDTRAANLGPLLQRLQKQNLIERHENGFRRVSTNGTGATP